jgi:hypothetical protein
MNKSDILHSNFDRLRENYQRTLVTPLLRKVQEFCGS